MTTTKTVLGSDDLPDPGLTPADISIRILTEAADKAIAAGDFEAVDYLANTLLAVQSSLYSHELALRDHHRADLAEERANAAFLIKVNARRVSKKSAAKVGVE